MLRLTLDLRATAPELEECEVILRELKGTLQAQGRVGVLQLDRRRLVLDVGDIETQLSKLPDVLRATVERLKSMESGEQSEVARTALYHLYKLAREAGVS